MESSMIAQRDAGSTVGMVPVLSVGWSPEAWDGGVGGTTTVNDFAAVASWAKNTFMPSLPSGSVGQQMVLLDNWNEYGEGHYIMPSSLGGFGYLNALRSVFTSNPAENPNETPTPAQKARLNVLYPNGWVGHAWNFDGDQDAEGWAINN